MTIGWHFDNTYSKLSKTFREEIKPVPVYDPKLIILNKKLAEDLNLIDNEIFSFCWIIDYPMYEIDETTKKIKFSHNPFSMPQGEINKLDLSKPLNIKAYQYDIVCNGIELSSGAIRNHVPELMYKLFEIAGYSKIDVNSKFEDQNHLKKINELKTFMQIVKNEI